MNLSYYQFSYYLSIMLFHCAKQSYVQVINELGNIISSIEFVGGGMTIFWIKSNLQQIYHATLHVFNFCVKTYTEVILHVATLTQCDFYMKSHMQIQLIHFNFHGIVHQISFFIHILIDIIFYSPGVRDQHWSSVLYISFYRVVLEFPQHIHGG